MRDGVGARRRALRAFVVMVALAAGCSTGQPPPAVATGPLEAASPKGPVAFPFAFAWRGAAADAVVRLRVYDEAERMVYGIEARGSQAPAPEDLKRLLKHGATYQWRVARVDDNGQEVDQSEMTPFSVP